MKYFFHIIIIAMLCFNFVPGTLSAATGSGTALGGASGSGPASGGASGSGVAKCEGICLNNPIQADSVGELFQAIIDIVLVFAIPIVVFFIILAGFRYVTARGNGHVIEEAHMALLYALIGGVLILGARVLIEVISGTVDAIKG